MSEFVEMETEHSRMWHPDRNPDTIHLLLEYAFGRGPAQIINRAVVYAER